MELKPEISEEGTMRKPVLIVPFMELKLGMLHSSIKMFLVLIVPFMELKPEEKAQKKVAKAS